MNIFITLFSANIDLEIKNGASRHFLDLYKSFKKYENITLAYVRKKGKFGISINKNGIKFISIPNIASFKIFGTFLTLLLFEIIFLFDILLNENFRKVNVIYLRQTPLNFAVLFIHLFFKKPFIVETNSIVIEDLKERKRNIFIRLIYFLEKINFRYCSHIIIVTEQMKSYLILKYKVPEQKITVIPNGYYFEKDFDYNKKYINLKSQFTSNKIEKFILLYYGNLHTREGIDFLLKATSILIDNFPVEVYIIGEGIEENNLKTLSKKLRIDNCVTFTGPLSKKEAASYISKAHICLAPLVINRNSVIGVSPIKIFEYLAYRKPVIVSRLPGLEFIEKKNIGLLVKPEDVNDLVEKIIYLFKNYNFAINMGNRGFEYVKKYHNWAVLSKRINSLIKKSISY